MTQKFGQTVWGGRGIAAWGILAATVVPGSAFAAQSDILIDQLSQGSGWAAHAMGQISPVAAGSAFVAQAQPKQGLAPVAFQANGGGLSFAQVARTEQISQDLSSGGAPVEMAFLGFGLDLGNYYHSGTGALSMEDANGNALQQDWRGEGNLQFASQQGTGNRAVQQQYGARNMAILFQRGTMNVGEVLQLSDQGVVTLLQNGDRNSASVTQATASSFASISQTGVANIVAVRQ